MLAMGVIVVAIALVVMPGLRSGGVGGHCVVVERKFVGGGEDDSGCAGLHSAWGNDG